MRKVLPIVALILACCGALADDDRGRDRGITRPTTITEPGVYVVQRSFFSPDEWPAIVVAASGVTIDLGGHTLSGPGGRRGLGILVDGVRGVRIINGTLASFGIGVQVSGADNVTVRGLQIIGEDLGGTPPAIEIGVLVVNSRGVVLTENTISRVFLGIFVRGGMSSGNRLADNTLAAGANGGLGICYNPSPTAGAADGPHGDLVYNNLVSRFGKGIQTSQGTTGNVFRENAVAYTGATGIDEQNPGANIFMMNSAIRINP